MYLGPVSNQDEEPRYKWIGVSGAFVDTHLNMWLDAYHPSGTMSGIPILLGSSDPEPIPVPETRVDKPFFIEFTRCKPPFELKEDGVYLGKSKIIDRVLPVE